MSNWLANVARSLFLPFPSSEGAAASHTVGRIFPDPFKAVATSRIDPTSATVSPRVDPFAATTTYQQVQP